MQLRINVGSDIMYVGGTVNDLETIFSGISAHVFVADVPQAEDDRYKLDLQMVDEAGNTSNYQNTITYILPSFIYDRTQKDVDRANELNEKYLNRIITDEEKQEWNTGINKKVGLKGVFGLPDIKRTENNCKIIGELLAETVNVKEWTRGQRPIVSDYARILANVAKLKGGYNFPSIPPVPKQPLNTYQKWNDIEKILHDVFYIYIGIKNNYYYCDTEVYTGEGIGVL